MHTPLSLAAQTAYAQLLDASLTGDYLRTVADLPGNFTSKSVKGHDYRYYQFRDLTGKLRQIYLGPATDEVLRVIERKSVVPPQEEALGRLSRSAAALGCQPLPFRQYRVVERLADHGLFRAGAVLVGTHAFLAYGNMLGVRWSSGEQTQDVDFAHPGKSLSLALRSDLAIDVGSAIESLQAGFLPVTTFSGKPAASFLNPREPEFRLDFLTTLHRGGETPYRHEPLGVTLQPLKFMEFSLENLQQAVVFSGDRGVVVNIPHPTRFAVHKLLVCSERSGSFAAKSAKDLVQVGSLLTVLGERMPHTLKDAVDDAASRGRGWKKNLTIGMQMLARQYPEAAALIGS